MDDQIAIQEAAYEGVKGMDHLLRLLSHHQTHISSASNSMNQIDCREITDFTIAKFKKVISMLNRTGRARFRRGPISPPPSSFTTSASPSTSDSTPVELPATVKAPAYLDRSGYQPVTLTLDFSKPNLVDPKLNAEIIKTAAVSNSQSISVSTTASSSFMSSITGEIGGEGSVSNGKLGNLLFAAPVVTAGKPPLATSSMKRGRDHDHQSENIPAAADNLHCTKKSKTRVKKTIRVPAISSKVADIPNDECSWRKYGQKPIKGSPYPRGYYRCSSMRGCPAKKHVERDPNDPTMLIVTYEGVHDHSNSALQENAAVDSGAVALS